MVANEIFIKKYRWNLRIFYAVNHYHIDEMLHELSAIACPPDILARVEQQMEKRELNTGFTYSNMDIRRTVMIICLYSSRAEFINSLEHELRHMVDHIGQKDNLDLAGETVAYITGDTNGMLAEDIQMFMCDCNHCHRKKEERIY